MENTVSQAVITLCLVVVMSKQKDRFSCRTAKESSWVLCCFLVVTSVMQIPEKPGEILPLVEMGPIFLSAQSGATVDTSMAAGSGSDAFSLEITFVYSLRRSKSERQHMGHILGHTERAASC